MTGGRFGGLSSCKFWRSKVLIFSPVWINTFWFWRSWKTEQLFIQTNHPLTTNHYIHIIPLHSQTATTPPHHVKAHKQCQHYITAHFIYEGLWTVKRAGQRSMERKSVGVALIDRAQWPGASTYCSIYTYKSRCILPYWTGFSVLGECLLGSVSEGLLSNKKNKIVYF